MSHIITNKSLAEMFLNRKLYTRLDLISPTKENIIEVINTSKITKFFLTEKESHVEIIPEAKNGNSVKFQLG